MLLRVILFSALLSAALMLTGCVSPTDFRPSRPSQSYGHYERQITGYKLRRNPTYDIFRKRHSAERLNRWGMQEYRIEPEYSWVWVPE